MSSSRTSPMPHRAARSSRGPPGHSVSTGVGVHGPSGRQWCTGTTPGSRLQAVVREEPQHLGAAAERERETRGLEAGQQVLGWRSAVRWLRTRRCPTAGRRAASPRSRTPPVPPRVQDRRETEAHRAVQVEGGAGVGEDRVRVAQIRVRVGRPAFRTAGQQRTGVGEDHRVVVDVHDPGVRATPCAISCTFGRVGEAGADVEELAQPHVTRQVQHRTPHEVGCAARRGSRADCAPGRGWPPPGRRGSGSCRRAGRRRPGRSAGAGCRCAPEATAGLGGGRCRVRPSGALSVIGSSCRVGGARSVAEEVVRAGRAGADVRALTVAVDLCSQLAARKPVVRRCRRHPCHARYRGTRGHIPQE